VHQTSQLKQHTLHGTLVQVCQQQQQHAAVGTTVNSFLQGVGRRCKYCREKFCCICQNTNWQHAVQRFKGQVSQLRTAKAKSMDIAKCTVEGKAEVVKALEQRVKVSWVHLCWAPALSALHICNKNISSLVVSHERPDYVCKLLQVIMTTSCRRLHATARCMCRSWRSS